MSSLYHSHMCLNSDESQLGILLSGCKGAALVERLILCLRELVTLYPLANYDTLALEELAVSPDTEQAARRLTGSSKQPIKFNLSLDA